MDIRRRYTRKIINQTFFSLLKKRDIDKVTVSEICKECNINRSTFYRNYHDIYDIVDQFFQEITTEILKSFSSDDLSMDQKFTLVFSKLYEHKDSFMLLKKKRLLKRLNSPIFNATNHAFGNNFSSSEWYFLFYGFSGLIKYWFDQDMNVSVSEMSKISMNLFSKFISSK
ncbi:TetR family transcriptional regulator [Companilactobacillus farciminis]|nr:TetR family transcriptional regulator [Companilactobacillus farciminis]